MISSRCRWTSFGPFTNLSPRHWLAKYRPKQQGLGPLSHNVKKMSHARRPYPRVFPKYRNPAKPSETWAGRGKKPRWLAAQLKSGKRIDDFRMQPSEQARRRAH